MTSGGRVTPYDIAIDGVSLVANYRSQFATQIKRKGVASLITALQERNHKTDSK